MATQQIRRARTTATFELTLPIPQDMTLKQAQEWIQKALSSQTEVSSLDQSKIRVKLARKTVFYP